MDRDFKGVWIPKEIWLCKELSALDRVIYAEIDSLDNENHCTASNEYFAEFCGVSEPTITRSIQKLIDKGYIAKVSFDGRHRILKVIKQTNQNDDPESSKCSTNNINSNIDKKEKLNNKLFSTEDASYSKPKKVKKANLYEKCIDYIMQYTNNIVLQEKLKEYLNLRLEIAKGDSKPFYYNMWPPIINELDELAKDTNTAVKIVEQSIRCGWRKFFPLKEYNNKSNIKANSSENGVTSEHETEEEYNKRMELAKRREEAGEQSVF